MNSKWHFWLSFSKSFIRITGCMLAILSDNLLVLAICFGIAEILGILEEVKDER